MSARMEVFMDRVRKILVATDYSEQARRAETRAAMLSVELKADTLEMMTVQNTRMGLRAAATSTSNTLISGDVLTSFLEKQEGSSTVLQGAEGPTCIRSIRVGKPSAAIVARANEMGADLTVVAAHGRNFFAELFARHSNDELVRVSDRPVLLVNSEPKDAYKKVLVAIDFSYESREAARVALSIAPSANYTFLHAFHVPDEGMMREVGIPTDTINSYRVRACETARGELNQFIADLGPRKQLISRAIHHGFPLPVISDYAKRLRADLIAVGKHGKSRFEELLLGSVTQRLVNETSCDLLITPMSGGDDWYGRPAA
jgi:nucleotide-binding universal stress UspA family protein